MDMLGLEYTTELDPGAADNTVDEAEGSHLMAPAAFFPL